MNETPVSLGELEKNGKLCPDVRSIGIFQHEVLAALRRNKEQGFQQRELAIEMTRIMRDKKVISKDKTITEQQVRQCLMRLVKKGLVDRWEKPIKRDVKDGHGDKTERIYYGIFYTAK